MLFAFTFFLVRVVLYGYGLIDLGLKVQHITRPALASKIFMFGGVVAGFLLNVTWFAKIIKIAKSSSHQKVD